MSSDPQPPERFSPDTIIAALWIAPPGPFNAQDVIDGLAEHRWVIEDGLRLAALEALAEAAGHVIAYMDGKEVGTLLGVHDDLRRALASLREQEAPRPAAQEAPSDG